MSDQQPINLPPMSTQGLDNTSTVSIPSLSKDSEAVSTTENLIVQNVEMGTTPSTFLGLPTLETIDVPVAETPTVTPVVSEPETPAAEQEQKQLTKLDPLPPSTTVQQDAEVSLPLPESMQDDIPYVYIPPTTQERIAEALEQFPLSDISKTKEGATWANSLYRAQFSIPFGKYFQGTVDREGAAFRQKLDTERGPLTAAAPSFKDQPGVKLTGERALFRVRSILGMGTVVQIPLWHSGFWITLRAPSDIAQIELNRRLMDEKITLGRQSYGLAFANTSVFFAAWLVDFALQHVYETTLKPELHETVRDHISMLDIPLLVWGLACVMWPKGFPYSRPIVDPQQPNKVVTEKIDVGKLLWVDNNAFTNKQKNHMANRFGTHTSLADLETYRKEFERGQPRLLVFNENLSVTLRIPSVTQYLVSGQKWINTLVAMVDKAFGMEQEDDKRNRYINDYGRATNMRQYAHCIENFIANGEIIDDADTIEEIVDTISSQDKILQIYFEGIRKFTDDSTVAVVAVPIVEGEESSTLPRFPHLLPIDVIHVFFILLNRKVEQIQEEE